LTQCIVTDTRPHPLSTSRYPGMSQKGASAFRQKIPVIFLVLIIVMGTGVRAFRFGSVPPGLNQDEASLGYDAYAVLHYGVEHNGVRLPVVFPQYGSGMSGAITAYLSMPFIAWFGLTEASTRMVNVVFGSLSIPILFLLIRKISDESTALFGAFLLAISPWHIMLSRWGLDCNLFPALFLIGVYLFVLAWERPRFLVASFAVFGLSLYAYGTAHFVVPIFLALSSAYLLWHERIRWRQLLPAAGLLLLIALPAMLYVLVNRFQWPSIVTPLFTIPRLPAQARFMAMSSIFSAESLTSISSNFQALFHLLLTQNDGLIWNVIPQYGILYLFSMPLAVLGAVLTLSSSRNLRRFQPSMMMLLWLLAALALAGVLGGNINRLNILFIPLIFLVAVAMRFLRPYPLVIATLIVTYLISFSSFTNAYFTTFPQQIGPAFFASLGAAINEASEGTGGTICVTDQVSMAEISVLFYRKMDPHAFSDTVQYQNPGADFQHARSFDRYIFGLENCQNVKVGAYIVHNDEVEPYANRGFDLRAFENYTVVFTK